MARVFFLTASLGGEEREGGGGGWGKPGDRRGKERRERRGCGFSELRKRKSERQTDRERQKDRDRDGMRHKDTERQIKRETGSKSDHLDPHKIGRAHV